MAVQNISLRDYWDRLNRHDWTYEMSEDQRAYNEGSRERGRLREIAKQSREHRDLYKGFCDHNPLHGGPALPKPPRP